MPQPSLPDHYKVLYVELYPSSITGEYVAYYIWAWDTKRRCLVQRQYEEIASIWEPSLGQLATEEEIERAAIHTREVSPRLTPAELDAEVASWRAYRDERYSKT